MPVQLPARFHRIRAAPTRLRIGPLQEIGDAVPSAERANARNAANYDTHCTYA